MILQTWQLVASLATAFVFGLGIGRGLGTVACWAKGHEDKEEQA